MADASDPLLRVCSLLNEHGARYLIVGGYACILHGLVRTTEDVDVLAAESEENFARIIAGLSELAEHAARELTPSDFIEHVVVKICDEVEVDVSKRAWKVTFVEAEASALKVEIEGVTVPYVDLATLIATKDTYREQDRADLVALRRLAQRSCRAAD